jgi:CBS domain-containing protein
MKVKDIMTTSTYSVKATQYLNDAAHLMWEFDCGCMPVSDEDECITGVVTDRDICMAAYTNGLTLEVMPVSTAMSAVVYSCSEEDDIENAEDIMRHHQVRRLPVLDKKLKLKGILSLNDIALAYNNQSLGSSVKATDIAKTLRSVCEHTHGSLMTMAS